MRLSTPRKQNFCMEIYLDSNATTSVLPQAREAAVNAMLEGFGNPSSIHSTGLRARAILDETRACARRVLSAPSGRLVFTSGATEGIQTAILSALTSLSERRAAGEGIASLLLYGATEHKAVPEAIKHWNKLLGLDLEVQPIPVGSDGRHDLAWLREQAPRAALICTMAVNNETGVVSDLAGIAAIVAGSQALWLVDGVQALGKIELDLERRRIDYATFSGHKLYAPKGIGMLYVREDAPYTPLMAGGGQEGAARSGTENMTGIAALGAVLQALEAKETFRSVAELERYREQLLAALTQAFPGLALNAPLSASLPTTLNFSIPGVSSRLLLDLFDAAGIRVSAGSACGAAKAQPSYVLEAMGLPAWRTASAVRLSFGAADSPKLIAEACTRILACGDSLRETCQLPELPAEAPHGTEVELLTRFVVDGSCCYLVADATTRRCVVIDPLPELTETLVRWLRCRSCSLVAVLDTHGHGDHATSAGALREAAGTLLEPRGALEGLGWPTGQDAIEFGALRLSRLPVPGHTQDSTAYLLHAAGELTFVFVGDTVMPGALGRSDFAQSAPLAFAPSLRLLEQRAGRDSILLPAHDYDMRLASTLRVEAAFQPLLAGALEGKLTTTEFAERKADLERQIAPTEFQTMACGARVECASRTENVELSLAHLLELKGCGLTPRVVDVREGYEHMVGSLGGFDDLPVEQVPMSAVLNALPRWCAGDKAAPLVFVCRSGNRSAQAARALRRLGYANAWSLAGGLALNAAVAG
jgi:cysteine sulfinate desulfinase/cysteine desulfurase-like protein/glyoxylase-like metal-dependent hydrolase (beta-lactamase superfamily II)/rhodanese-related sulfurtransferase